MFIKINRALIPLIVFSILTLNPHPSAAERIPTLKSFIPLLPYHQSGWLGPFGGYIVATAIDPLNPQVVFAGTWGSGVYKSQDGGQTWQAANFGLGNLYINSLAIDPARPSTLFAGTYKSQIYKSIDGGLTWVWSGSGMQDQAVVYTIAIDPIEPSTLYAGTRGSSNNGSEPWSGILYKSVDGGQTWLPSLTDIGGEEVQDWVYSIAINPAENNSIYAASHEHGPFHSNNYGASWYSIHDGIKDDSGRSIIVDPNTSTSTTVYYGVWHFDSVYKSYNGGNDWFLSGQGIPFTKVYGMAIDPIYTDKVYLATFNRGVVKTIDGGDSWTPTGLQDDLIYNLSINPITPTVLFAGTAGDGLFNSSDGGTGWQPSNKGIENAMATRLIVSSTNPNKLYAAVYGAGVYASEDFGQSWNEMNTGLTDKFVHTLVQNPIDPNILFALTDTGGLFKNDLSDHNGWINIRQGLPLTNRLHPAYSTSHPFVTYDMLQLQEDTNLALPGDQLATTNLLTMAFSHSEPQIVYLGTGGSGVYKSVDGGLSWHPSGLAGESIQSVAVDYIDAELVYAATSTTGSLKISSDGGTTWTDSKLPVTFYSLSTSPVAKGLLFAATSGGVYRYSSGNWTYLGLGDEAVTTLTINPELPARIFAGTTSGTFYSTDAGISWQMLDWNLKDLTIQSIDFDPADHSHIYISTKTHGIYYTLVDP